MNHEPLPQKILVPQGAEYKAVCRGLSRVKCPKLQVLPIPVGPKPLAEYLKQWQQSEDYRNDPPLKILVMGLCGSLSPQLVVGDIVVYQGCVGESDAPISGLRSCDEELTTVLHNKLEKQVPVVKALTCDRIIVSAQEKCHLTQLYDTQVVDMEGYAALETLAESGVAVAMLRVISDDSHHNL
ncbi:MAG TPA: phosphorylase, partial [Coleofasciculaceae cyanobacterium]